MTDDIVTIEGQRHVVTTYLSELKSALVNIKEDKLLNNLRFEIEDLIEKLSKFIERTDAGIVYSPRHFEQRISEILFDIERVFNRTLKMTGASTKLYHKINSILKVLREKLPELFNSELEEAFAQRELETNPIYKLIVRELNSSNKSVKNEYQKLQNSIENIRSEITSAVAEAKKDTEQAETEVKEILETLKVSAEQAKVTVGLIGATAVSSAHRDRADEERKIASRLRNGVLASLSISASIILLSVLECLPLVVGWQDLVLRYGAVIFFTIPASSSV